MRTTNTIRKAAGPSASLEQKPNLRGVVQMVRGGLFLRKKPLGDSASHYTNSAFAISGWLVALVCVAALLGMGATRSLAQPSPPQTVPPPSGPPLTVRGAGAPSQTGPNTGTHPAQVSPSETSTATPSSASVPVSDGTSHTAIAAMQPAPPAQGLMLDRLIAVVNDDLVLESDIQEEMRFATFQPNGPTSRAAAIERLIDRELIEEQEHYQQPRPVTDAELSADVADLRKSLPACAHAACSTEADWRAFLAEHGFTQAEFDARWRERMGILRFIEQRFRLGVRIPQSQVDAYYKETMLPAYAKRDVKPPPLATVQDRIQEVLLQQQVNTLLDTWLKTLRAQGNVRLINDAEAAP